MSGSQAEAPTPPRRRTRKTAESSEPAKASTSTAGSTEAPRPAGGNGNEATFASASERAEEMIDHAGERFGRMMAGLTADLRRSIARAKEEAEDIWAEARDKQQQRHRQD